MVVLCPFFCFDFLSGNLDLKGLGALKDMMTGPVLPDTFASSASNSGASSVDGGENRDLNVNQQQLGNQHLGHSQHLGSSLTMTIQSQTGEPMQQHQEGIPGEGGFGVFQEPGQAPQNHIPPQNLQKKGVHVPAGPESQVSFLIQEPSVTVSQMSQHEHSQSQTLSREMSKELSRELQVAHQTAEAREHQASRESFIQAQLGLGPLVASTPTKSKKQPGPPKIRKKVFDFNATGSSWTEGDADGPVPSTFCFVVC